MMRLTKPAPVARPLRALGCLAGTLLLSASILAGSTGMLQFGSRAYANGASVTATGEGQRIKLGLNKSIVVDLPADAYDILVANPAVADAVTRTARRIYLFGKSVGQTNVFVFGPNGEQIANLQLEIERDVAGLRSEE